MEIDFSELVIESQISEGGYGIIYKGLWRETTVAIKMFKIESENGVKDFFSECAAMEALRHPNIVMFLGACTKPPNFAIVLEYCGKGSLWSTIQNLEVPLSW
jgi:mitogen-activated protein kinase kinase kinase 9